MALWKRGRRYWTQVMIHGVRIRRPLCPAGSSRATTKWQEAIQLEKDLIRAAMEGKLGTHSAPTRLFDACEKYLTAKEATAHTKRAVEFDRERLEVVKLFVEMGADVNQADDYGITPLMVAGNMGDTAIIQYLVDQGADLGAYDLGKKNDGAFGASVEPLMPVDYAIGVGTFVPNNAVIIHEEAVALMFRMMKERGITHTTSECTLRGFTCAQANVDPKYATPAEIQKMRALAIGHQVEGITGGLEAK